MKGRLKRTALKSKTTSTDNQKMEISDKTQKGHFKGNMDSLQRLLRCQMLAEHIWQVSMSISLEEQLHITEGKSAKNLNTITYYRFLFSKKNILKSTPWNKVSFPYFLHLIVLLFQYNISICSSTKMGTSTSGIRQGDKLHHHEVQSENATFSLLHTVSTSGSDSFSFQSTVFVPFFRIYVLWL